MPSQQEFNQIYRASLPPAVRNLMDIQDDGGDGSKEKLAADLARQGYLIDVPIQVWGWDPYLTMALRQSFGYTWVSSALLAPVMVAPGLPGFGTLPAYDPKNPPPGSIKVSLDPADYPPFDPPVTVTVVTPPAVPVGQQAVGNLYLSVVGELYPDGAKFSDARGTFEKHISLTPFGRNSYWEKIG